MKTKNTLFIIPVLFGLLLAGCGNDNSGSEPTPATIQDFSSAVFLMSMMAQLINYRKLVVPHQEHLLLTKEEIAKLM